MSKKDKKNKDEYELTDASDISADAERSAADRVSDVSADSDHVTELEAELAETKSQLARAVADYHNLEKRVAESRGELAAWANGDLLRRIVPVLDHFDRALKGAEEAGESGGWLKGVEMAAKELRKTLAESGLEEVEVEEFDPNLHEAVEVTEGPSGKILKVVEMGYTLNGKVLKPAKVVVGRS